MRVAIYRIMQRKLEQKLKRKTVSDGKREETEKLGGLIRKRLTNQDN